MIIQLTTGDFMGSRFIRSEQSVTFSVVYHRQHNLDIRREILRKPTGQILDFVIVHLKMQIIVLQTTVLRILKQLSGSYEQIRTACFNSSRLWFPSYDVLNHATQLKGLSALLTLWLDGSQMVLPFFPVFFFLFQYSWHLFLIQKHVLFQFSFISTFCFFGQGRALIGTHIRCPSPEWLIQYACAA